MRRSLSILKPPPELSISDWADANRRLSSEASAEPGQWRTSRAEYQRGIMDAISDGSVESVVIMSSSQVGKSEALANAVAHGAAVGDLELARVAHEALGCLLAHGGAGSAEPVADLGVIRKRLET